MPLDDSVHMRLIREGRLKILIEEFRQQLTESVTRDTSVEDGNMVIKKGPMFNLNGKNMISKLLYNVKNVGSLDFDELANSIMVIMAVMKILKERNFSVHVSESIPTHKYWKVGFHALDALWNKDESVF
jgi:hypothetical protein